MLDFIFFSIIYPIFRNQFDKLLTKYRLAQIHSIDNTPAGLVYVDITKNYPVDTELQIYKATTHIFDPDTHDFLGALEKIIGTARVVSSHNNNCSRAVMTRINAKLEAGLLVKSVDSQEFALKSFRRF